MDVEDDEAEGEFGRPPVRDPVLFDASADQRPGAEPPFQDSPPVGHSRRTDNVWADTE